MAGAVLALAGVLAQWPANSAPARGDALPLTLSWTAPEGCPAAPEVRQQVSEMVHASEARARYEPIDARGVVRRNADGTWSLELETSVAGLTGTRTLNGRGCEDLARAGALVLALTINAAPSQESSVPAPAPAPKPETPAPEIAPAPPIARAATQLRFAAAIDALLSAGQLPRVAEGAELRGEAEFGHLMLQVHGAAWLPQRSTSPDSTAGGTFDLADVGAAACGLAGLRYGFGVELCAGVGAAWMSGKGVGVPNASPPSEDWWAVAMGSAGARYRITARLTVRLAAEAWTFPFGRPSFALHETSAVFGPSEVSGRIALGLQFYL